MNIGIVIDGVLTDLEQFQFDYGSKFYFDQEVPLRNSRASYVQEIFHKHGNDMHVINSKTTFWEQYYELYLLKAFSRPFASEILRRLHEEGNQIFLFSMRTSENFSLSNDKIKKLTKLWLIEHDIYFDFLVFSDIINVDLMEKYSIDLFVDHMPKSIFKVSLHIPVVCFHAKYNELCHGENVYRVFSWYDFYQKIDLISKKESIKSS